MKGVEEGSRKRVDRPARILVVDDTPDNVHLLQLDLEDAGYEVVCATNGLDALDCAASENVDVILMDSMMPVMDGITALRENLAISAAATGPPPLTHHRGSSPRNRPRLEGKGGNPDYPLPEWEIHSG